MQQLGQIIAMGNCHVLKTHRENKRSEHKLDLTCTRKQVSSKFITSLLLCNSRRRLGEKEGVCGLL